MDKPEDTRTENIVWTTEDQGSFEYTNTTFVKNDAGEWFPQTTHASATVTREELLKGLEGMRLTLTNLVAEADRIKAEMEKHELTRKREGLPQAKTNEILQLERNLLALQVINQTRDLKEKLEEQNKRISQQEGLIKIREITLGQEDKTEEVIVNGSED